MFDLTCITVAFQAADAAATAFDALTAEMVQWYESGEYPERADVIAAIAASGRKESTAKVYASRILTWAKAGKLPKTINELVNDGPKASGKGGRPKGKGKAATKATEATPADKPSVPNTLAAWRQFLAQIQAEVPKRADWAAEDIRAAQDLCGTLIALLKRNE